MPPRLRRERLWSELSNPAWSRRQAAHVEILRRGDAMLAGAAERLQAAALRDPAIAHLIWLAAASHQPQARTVLTSLATHEDPMLRATAIRALAEFRADDQGDGVFAKALAAANPAVRLAAVVALFDSREPLPEAFLTGPACTSDTYLRQASAMLIARRGTQTQLERLLQSSEPAQRLAGVLAAGFRLTVPPATGELPADLPLNYESGNADFVIQYADEQVDLKKLARIGSFTTAERWKALPPSEEERWLYEALLERVEDADERVHQQAAYFASLLDDPEANELVARVRRSRTLARLSAAPQCR